MNKQKVSVEYSLIIPCYNELKSLEPLFESCLSLLENRDDIEVVLVNNGSTDGSEKVMHELAQKSENYRLKILTIKENQGYGFGVISGLNSSTGSFIGWCHADLQTDPTVFLEAINLLNLQKNPRKSYIKAIRHGRKFRDSIFTYLMTVIEFFLLGRWMLDINSQPNLFHRDLMKEWKNPPYDFSLDLYSFYIAKKLELSFVRFPVYFGPRFHGVGHNDRLSSKFKLSFRTIKFSYELRKRLKNAS